MTPPVPQRSPTADAAAPPSATGLPRLTRPATPTLARAGEASTLPTDTVAPASTAPSTASNGDANGAHEFAGLDETLAAELPTFELFFKTFGFKRVHGRVWGLLVLAGQPLSSREISHALSLSQGATSMALNELAEWGAVRSDFDAQRRCHRHAPVGNTLSIVATVFRRREQVAIGRLRVSAQATLGYVREKFGERDARVLTLRSLLTSLDLADAVMQLVFSSVERALGDSESILSRAVGAALKVGLKAPRNPRAKGGKTGAARSDGAPLSAKELLARLPADEDHGDDAGEDAAEDANSDVDVQPIEERARPRASGGAARAKAPAGRGGHADRGESTDA